MKIPIEIVERIVSGTFQELYNIFITLEEQYTEKGKDFNKDYLHVRFGKEIKFEIQDLWENTNSIVYKPKNNIVLINGIGYSITEFRTEKEFRRKIMAEAIMENTIDDDQYKPRG